MACTGVGLASFLRIKINLPDPVMPVVRQNGSSLNRTQEMFRTVLYATCIAIIVSDCKPAHAEGLKPLASQSVSAQAPQPVAIINGGILIAVLSKSRRSVTVFNHKTSTETTVELSKPLPKNQDIAVSTHFVAFQTADGVYALNAKNAVWSRLPLPPNSQLRFEVSDNAILVSDDSFFYCYGRLADAWAGISIAEGTMLPSE
jgi:hypothetical protein